MIEVTVGLTKLCYLTELPLSVIKWPLMSTENSYWKKFTNLAGVIVPSTSNKHKTSLGLFTEAIFTCVTWIMVKVRSKKFWSRTLGDTSPTHPQNKPITEQHSFLGSLLHQGDHNMSSVDKFSFPGSEILVCSADNHILLFVKNLVFNQVKDL